MYGGFLWRGRGTRIIQLAEPERLKFKYLMKIESPEEAEVRLFNCHGEGQRSVRRLEPKLLQRNLNFRPSPWDTRKPKAQVPGTPTRLHAAVPPVGGRDRRQW